jgi:hypothetical protein
MYEYHLGIKVYHAVVLLINVIDTDVLRIPYCMFGSVCHHHTLILIFQTNSHPLLVTPSCISMLVQCQCMQTASTGVNVQLRDIPFKICQPPPPPPKHTEAGTHPHSHSHRHTRRYRQTLLHCCRFQVRFPRWRKVAWVSHLLDLKDTQIVPQVPGSRS